MAWEIYISEENLLWFFKWDKYWHDNSVKQNNFLCYFKWNWYWHEFIQAQQEQNNNEQEEPLNDNEGE